MIKNCLYTVIISMMLFGCGTKSRHGITPSAQPVDPVRDVDPEEDISPQHAASLELTQKGVSLLKMNKPDDALLMFEQAVAMYPYNGPAYYYMSEAWLTKGNYNQAQAFNKMAQIHIKPMDGWLEKVESQRDKILNHHP